MIVLSLFDGMGCGYLALKKAGIKVDRYLASEIKEFAVNHTASKIPNITHLGDVTKLHYDKETQTLYKDCLRNDTVVTDENGNETIKTTFTNVTPVYRGKIDLLIGGSPCQNLSSVACLAGTRLGLEGIKSKLFYEYVRIKEEVNPTHFLLENVEMSKDNEDTFDKYMNIKGVHINSSLLSFQKRPRIYWTDLEIKPIEDKGILFKDYMLQTIPSLENALYVSRYPEYMFTTDKEKQLFSEEDKKEIIKHITITPTGFDLNITDEEVTEICNIKQNLWLRKQLDAKQIVEGFDILTDRQFVEILHNSLKEALVKKTPSRDSMCGFTEKNKKCVDVTNADKICCLTRKQDRYPNSGLIKIGNYKRYISRYELCQAQNIPYYYLCNLNYFQIQDVCGDGWTVDVITHIFNGLNDGASSKAPNPKTEEKVALEATPAEPVTEPTDSTETTENVVESVDTTEIKEDITEGFMEIPETPMDVICDTEPFEEETKKEDTEEPAIESEETEDTSNKGKRVMTFNLVQGGQVKVKRTFKRLRLVNISEGDFYRSTLHTNYYFKDDETGEDWVYPNPYNTNVGSVTVIGKELDDTSIGKTFKIGGYFVEDKPNIIFRPRLCMDKE